MNDYVTPKYKPLSPWAYFGYSLLFNIPIVGFILLLVFSLSTAGNVNLRNYARSYFVGLIIAFILISVLLLAGAISLSGIPNFFKDLFETIKK